jgi:transporter family-2 protein
MGETLKYAAIMLAAGIGIPILAALNAQLGGRIGSPVVAAVVLFCVALLASVAVMALTHGPGALRAVPAQPRHLLLGGLLVCFYVLSVTFVAPRFGVGNAVFFVLLGQMISAGLIDQFGLFGAIQRDMTLQRLAGIGAMVLGLVLILRA